MKSILQEERDRCFLCGKNVNFEPLDKHHVFEGPYRNASEKYGLFVYIHHSSCHIFGEKSVHKNHQIQEELKAYAQKIAMKEYGWTVEDFIKRFGKSHI